MAGEGDELVVPNPSDGSAVARLPGLSPDLCEAAVQAAHRAFARGEWSRLPMAGLRNGGGVNQHYGNGGGDVLGIVNSATTSFTAARATTASMAATTSISCRAVRAPITCTAATAPIC